MPIPVSVTCNAQCSLSGRKIRMCTLPLSVNLIALLTRLKRICCNRSISPFNAAGTSGATSLVNSSFLVTAKIFKAEYVVSSKSVGANRSFRRASLPCSIWARSSRLFTMPFNWVVFMIIRRIVVCCLSVRLP